MPERTSNDLLQPSLLDRLTDNEPEKGVESRERRVMSVRRLREAVFRDLSWLLNAGNMEAVTDLSDYPYVRDSVLNYGMRDITGRTEGSVQVNSLEREVAEIIRRFEPRIMPETVEVIGVRRKDAKPGNTLGFEIRADLWSHPLPEHLFLETEVDLESGEVAVRPASR